VAGELVHHVIQEAHAACHPAAAAATKAEGHPHIGFSSIAVDLADAIRNAQDGRGFGERAIMADEGIGKASLRLSCEGSRCGD